ncbi:unnamed protein product [Allacma fusca]|uniref:Uncharacterized protein n=1 Tax=Allacma fusca TaxID=39272 RepID=A0A8J2JFY9_9HEXA|nr:unnamed protein product [Allacma fusca]
MEQESQYTYLLENNRLNTAGLNSTHRDRSYKECSSARIGEAQKDPLKKIFLSQQCRWYVVCGVVGCGSGRLNRMLYSSSTYITVCYPNLNGLKVSFLSAILRSPHQPKRNHGIFLSV